MKEEEDEGAAPNVRFETSDAQPFDFNLIKKIQ